MYVDCCNISSLAPEILCEIVHIGSVNIHVLMVKRERLQ